MWTPVLTAEDGTPYAELFIGSQGTNIHLQFELDEKSNPVGISEILCATKNDHSDEYPASYKGYPGEPLTLEEQEALAESCDLVTRGPALANLNTAIAILADTGLKTWLVDAHRSVLDLAKEAQRALLTEGETPLGGRLLTWQHGNIMRITLGLTEYDQRIRAYVVALTISRISSEATTTVCFSFEANTFGTPVALSGITVEDSAQRNTATTYKYGEIIAPSIQGQLMGTLSDMNKALQELLEESP